MEVRHPQPSAGQVTYLSDVQDVSQPFDGWREPTTAEEMQAWVGRYARGGDGHGPVRYVREVKRCQPYAWQVEALTAYGKRYRSISIRSGHNVGKTAFDAWVIDHFHTIQRAVRGAVTAPTEKQMFNVIYPEVLKWLKRGPVWTHNWFVVTAEKIAYQPHEKDWYTSFATARPENPEALAGVHLREGEVLLLADEASGVHEKVFESASGSMADDNATTILTGNPVRTSGLFFDSHHKLKWDGQGTMPPGQWFTLHVDGETSEQVSKQFLAEAALRWGKDSNQYRVRVKGEFPTSDADTIIPYEHVLSAQTRDIQEPKDQASVWGVDPARFGDDRSAMTKRRGKVVSEVPKVWRQKDTMQLSALIHEEWNATPLHERPKVICVDSIGLGAGVVDRLRMLGLPVRGVNVAETAAFTDRYSNLKAELWFKAKEWFASKDVKIPEDDPIPGGIALGSELAMPKFRFLPSGKLQVESKTEIKKRGYPSPDVADSFILTLADTATSYVHGTEGSSSEPIKRSLSWVV